MNTCKECKYNANLKCYRYPPSIVAKNFNVVTIYSTIKDKYFCGEFKKSK